MSLGYAVDRDPARIIPLPFPHLSYRDTPHGREKYCTVCMTWWPADEEFFYRKQERLRAPCIACDNARRRS